MARKTTKNVITTPELIESINPENQKLVNKFIRNFQTKSSSQSVINYKSDYNIFFCWNVMYNDNKFFIDIKKSELVEFFNFAVDTLEWGGARYRRCHSALSSLSSFIERVLDDDYPNFKNLLPKIDKIPKTVEREKTVLTAEQIENLINWIINEKENVQWACFLSLAINSGARISELLRFKVDMIDENNLGFNGLFLKTTKKIQCKGRGKDGYLDYKYILKDPFLPIFHQWLNIRKEILENNNIKEHGYLFINRDGEPISTSGIRRWQELWEKYLTEEEPSNINKEQVHVYAHAFRHYTVSSWVRIGLTVETIVAIMGWHGGDSMFYVYNDVSIDEREWNDLAKLEEYLKKDE